MQIVDRLYRDEPLGVETDRFVHDTITLGWEERQKGHARRRTDGGVEFGLSLPAGAILREGDRIILDSLQRIVTVCEAEEDVYVIQPRTPQEWAWHAYQIGNRHQPLMIDEAALVCPRTPDIDQLFRQLQIAAVPARRRFTPAVARVGHDH